MERDHQGWREIGKCSFEFRRPEDYGNCWRLVWRGALCDVREGFRSALCVCLAHGAVRGHERRFGGRNAGRDKGEATGAWWKKAERGRKKRTLRIREAHLRRANRPALRSSAALDRQDHRSN